MICMHSCSLREESYIIIYMAYTENCTLQLSVIAAPNVVPTFTRMWRLWAKERIAS